MIQPRTPWAHGFHDGAPRTRRTVLIFFNSNADFPAVDYSQEFSAIFTSQVSCMAIPQRQTRPHRKQSTTLRAELHVCRFTLTKTQQAEEKKSMWPSSGCCAATGLWSADDDAWGPFLVVHHRLLLLPSKTTHSCHVVLVAVVIDPVDWRFPCERSRSNRSSAV